MAPASQPQSLKCQTLIPDPLLVTRFSVVSDNVTITTAKVRSYRMLNILSASCSLTSFFPVPLSFTASPYVKNEEP
jgi:hypothetical protein